MKEPKIMAILPLLTLTIFAHGCDSGPTDDKPKTRKLTFHCPKNFSSAITRVQKIHDTLIGTDEFPQPLKIKYVEVVHGEGASAHSHYYLASKYQPGKGTEDHDEEMKETVKEREYEVNFRTELADIMRWLPSLASQTDLEETDWNSVSDISKQFKEIIASVSEDKSDADFRQNWKSNESEINKLLQKLKEMNAKLGAAE